jgi:hypothetical protein
MAVLRCLTALALAVGANALTYNTFDGPGFPACNNVSTVHDATSVKDIQNTVQNAIKAGQRVRASGKAHMWYDTMCSDDPNTVIIRTENVNKIYDLDLDAGTVMIEAGVTFLQLADYLHQRGASAGYTLVNWNITLAGCVAMGAHRSSIREDSMVAAGVLALDIIDGNGELRHLERDDSDEWLAASTSLGLLGVIVRMKFKIYPDFKVYADQKTLDESDVLDGDIYGMISPYATANLWVRTHLPQHDGMLNDISGGLTRRNSTGGTTTSSPPIKATKKVSRIHSQSPNSRPAPSQHFGTPEKASLSPISSQKRSSSDNGKTPTFAKRRPTSLSPSGPSTDGTTTFSSAVCILTKSLFGNMVSTGILLNLHFL